jgi:hypothetical protein
VNLDPRERGRSIPADPPWLSDYLLGECSDQQRAEIERQLADDPGLRARVDGLMDVAGHITGLSPAAWEAIALDRAPATRTRPRRGARPVRRAVALAGAVAVFAAGLAVGLGLNASSSGRAVRRVALQPLPGTPPTAAGSAYLAPGNHLALVVHHLPTTTPGHYYEAWLMTSLTRLVPLGSFRVDDHGDARLTLTLPAAAAAYRFIDVSVQRTAAGLEHSDDSVLRGPT